ncbi:TnpV protein (plasmid) [Arthrobacter agilis]|uniref:TnpV protein n=1 Tax=Arthrobacter agilis TaxID=37921 RepID=UPI0023668DFD|nr:TnpV protein [Arthrobacter agilis]WDF35157.1 TnpV protein [Arthrobacter agilis]
MNKYGKFAQETWKMTAPSQYALISDPEEWFRKLGEEAMRQVGELQYQIAGPDPEGETYLEKVGRLNASRMQAEEIVRAEMLTPETMETEGDETEEDEVDRRQREIWETHRSIVRLQQELLDEYREVEMDQYNQKS